MREKGREELSHRSSSNEPSLMLLVSTQLLSVMNMETPSALKTMPLFLKVHWCTFNVDLNMQLARYCKCTYRLFQIWQH